MERDLQLLTGGKGRRELRAALWLTAWSVALVAPTLIAKGTHVVTWTYAEAAQRLVSGTSPYLPPQRGDVFQYSPFFALAYWPFAALPDVIEALAWVSLNALVFWLGVTAWFTPRRSWPAAGWVALALCSMELDGSLRYQQANGLITGLILLGVAAYRAGRLAGAGSLLALGANLKLLPLVFLGMMAWPVRRAYWLAAAVTLAGLFVLPGVVAGPAGTVSLHVDWIAALMGDIPKRQLLDIRSAFAKLGHDGIGRAAWLAVAVATTVLFATEWLRPGTRRWGLWVSLGLLGLCLLSPKTESPTFVLIAPVYLFLCAEGSLAARLVLVPAAFLTSLVYNSLWPRGLRFGLEVNYLSKPFGALLLWGLCAALIAASIRNYRSASPRP